MMVVAKANHRKGRPSTNKSTPEYAFVTLLKVVANARQSRMRMRSPRWRGRGGIWSLDHRINVGGIRGARQAVGRPFSGVAMMASPDACCVGRGDPGGASRLGTATLRYRRMRGGNRNSAPYPCLASSIKNFPNHLKVSHMSSKYSATERSHLPITSNTFLGFCVGGGCSRCNSDRVR